MAEENKGAATGEKKPGGRRRRGRGRGSQGGDNRKPERSKREDGGGRGRDNRGRRGRRRSGDAVEELGARSGIDVVDISNEPSKGAHRLEPGLTLKDLLPFLRPPKNVWILGASTGSGHNRSAAALAESLKELDRNLVVRQQDVLDLVDGESADVRRRLELLSQDTAFFGQPFETRVSELEIATSDTSWVDGLLTEKLDTIAVDKRPDHIICTHWLPLARLGWLAENERLKAPVTAVITDPDATSLWVNGVVEHYLVNHDGLRSRLQSLGVDASKISVTGVTVSPAFAAGVDKGAVARSLGLKGQTTTVLMRPGGIGSTERILEVVQAIMDLKQPMNLMVVAGKNEKLQTDLDALEIPDHVTLRTFGFVQNIHELMGVSDLLITRASPHTLAEAQAAGLPMLLLRPSEGIEDRAADRLLRSGTALKVYTAEDLVFMVDSLFSVRRRLKEMQEAAHRRRRPDAGRLTVDRLARLVR